MAEIAIVPDAVAGGAVAARDIAAIVTRNPEAVLGLATGSTPLTTWDALAAMRAEGLDLSRTTGFALDEYVGIAPGHPESYRCVIDREVVDRLGMDRARVHVPLEAGQDPTTAGAAYERAIVAAGGVDVQVLGIGRNGHVGFNEPGSSLASLTRIKTLHPHTREDNARFFGGSIDDVPVHCVTQGLGTILRARRLVLLAWGEAKAEALAGAVEGPVSAALPGSIIQLHPSVLVVADEAAASRLTGTEYYRFAWDHRDDLVASAR